MGWPSVTEARLDHSCEPALHRRKGLGRGAVFPFTQEAAPGFAQPSFQLPPQELAAVEVNGPHESRRRSTG